MKLDFTSERVLAVMAHPDDAELLCAGTLARARDDGAAIAICAMCNGDKGQSAAQSHANLADLRKSEALSSAPALWYADTLEMAGFEPAFYVDVSAHIKLKQQMLACHRSQLLRGSDPDFSPLAELMLRQSQARGHQANTTAAEAFR